MALSASSVYRVNPANKDVRLEPLKSRDGSIQARVIVHKTDRVTVMLACSPNPIATDILGIMRLSNELTRVEDYLEAQIRQALASSGREPPQETPSSPNHMGWKCVGFHLGRDGRHEYNGEKFNYTYHDINDAFVRVYAKQLAKDKKVIRVEKQVLSDKPLADALNELLCDRT